MSVRLLAPATILVTVVAGVGARRSRNDAPPHPSPAEVPAPSRPIDAIADSSETESTLGRSLIIPVAGVVSTALHDGFTEKRSGGRMHEAIDIMAPRGTPVVSATEGRLLRLHTSKAGGLMVYAADASDQFILMYAHLDRYASGLVEGAPLHKGQLLGFVGTTGNAPPNAPHLHFAIARGQPSVKWWKGVALNPYPLLAHAPSSVAPTIQLADAGDASKPPPVIQASSAKAHRASTATAKTRQASTSTTKAHRTSASRAKARRRNVSPRPIANSRHITARLRRRVARPAG